MPVYAYTYTTLDDPSGVGTVASGINDIGQIVGSYRDATGGSHGFFYNPNDGTYATIDNPLAINGTFVTGINDIGQIVGYYADGAGHDHGFLYSHGPFSKPIDVPLASNSGP